MNNYNTIYAAIGADGSFWMTLVEKAFAKLFGNYHHIQYGLAEYGVAALNGSPWTKIYCGIDKADEMWDAVVKAH